MIYRLFTLRPVILVKGIAYICIDCYSRYSCIADRKRCTFKSLTTHQEIGSSPLFNISYCNLEHNRNQKRNQAKKTKPNRTEREPINEKKQEATRRRRNHQS